MASLFADENVPFGLVKILGTFGHDVLTALAAGRANQKIPDPDVLVYAVSLASSPVSESCRDHYVHR